jgi:PadR family transcriptional regulator AphA
MTSYAVLGLLNTGEITGYDLLKHARQSMSYIWEPTKSHVYRELKRLVSIGLATERDVAQEHRPDKRIFKITPQGVSQFRSWLESSELEAESIRSPFLLQLFFGSQIERGLLTSRIEKYREQSRAELQLLDNLGERLKRDTEQLMSYLALRAAALRKSASIAWAEEALTELRRHS